MRSWIASGPTRRADAARPAPETRRAARAIGALCAAGLGLAALGAVAQPHLDLPTLMRHFAESRGVEADYQEEKTLPLLAAPLVSEGTLYFAPPDALARFTRAPEQASMVVQGEQLRIEDALGVEEIDLGAQPTARQIVDQLLVLFRGDLAALERAYEVRFDADGERWTLALVPRSTRVRQLIREITMRGHAGTLDEMVVLGAEGERTRTTYQRVVTDRVFSEAERARLFPALGSPQPLPRPDAADDDAADATATPSPETGPTP